MRVLHIRCPIGFDGPAAALKELHIGLQSSSKYARTTVAGTTVSHNPEASYDTVAWNPAVRVHQ